MRHIPFIQSVVASICRVKVDRGAATVERMHGTGFFVSRLGHLLTARHVIEGGQADVAENGGFLAFFPKLDDGTASQCLPIADCEFAPTPFDIALCCTVGPSRTFYRIVQRTVHPWSEVAAVGYPAAITKKTLEHYRVHTRFLRGYVQRALVPGELLDGDSPPAFEVSFPITQGMSGSPLFIYGPKHDFLVGICVGSVESRVVAYQNVEVKDPSYEFRESVNRIEEFGIAHSVLPLTEWRPSILNGRSLSEISDDAWAN